MAPSSQNVSARETRDLELEVCDRRIDREYMHDRRPFIARENISLQGERVLLGNVVVYAETAMQKVPAVTGVLAGKVGETLVVLIFRKDAVAGTFSEFPAILRCAERVRLGASASHHQDALRVGGLLGNNVDHAIHGVGAPQRSARSANHF